MTIDLTPEQTAAANVHINFWNGPTLPDDDLEPPEHDDEDHGPDPDTLRWLDEQITPPTARPTEDTLTLRWVHDALDNPPPEPPELVEGFMRAGEILAVAAPRSIGKSWLTYNLAALLDRGEGQFLGQLPVRQKVKTLIAQGEIDEWNAWDRWRFMLDGQPRPDSVAETFDRWRIRMMQRRNVTSDGQGTSFTDNWFDALLDPKIENTIREHDFGLLIVDPWAVYYGGQENSNDEAERALDKLRDLAVTTGCAVLIIHHIRGRAMGDGLEPEDMWRGASRLADWASTRVTLLPHYKTEKAWVAAGKNRQQARRFCDVHFMRRGKATDDFSIEYDPRSGWWRSWTDPTEADGATPAAGPSARVWNPVDVGELLDMDGGYWGSLTQASGAMDVTKATAKKYLEMAVAAGVLEECQGTTAGAHGFRVRPTGLFDAQAAGASVEEVPLDAYEDEPEMERF